MEANLNVEELRKGLNPNGLDPDLEIKAEDYAKRDWQLTVEPILRRTGLIQDLSLVAVMQEELFKLKYEYLVNAEETKQKASEAGLRWGLRS